MHVGLPASGVPGGVLHMVDGSYEYYHYLQVRSAGQQPCESGAITVNIGCAISGTALAMRGQQLLMSHWLGVPCVPCRRGLTTPAGGARTGHCRPSGPGSAPSTTPACRSPATARYSRPCVT